jgi:hypothetical protein
LQARRIDIAAWNLRDWLITPECHGNPFSVG